MNALPGQPTPSEQEQIAMLQINERIRALREQRMEAHDQIVHLKVQNAIQRQAVETFQREHAKLAQENEMLRQQLAAALQGNANATAPNGAEGQPV